MAPEQIVGKRAEIGPRSDVFALGATLYTLLTGRPPFQAASVIETLDLVRTREPAPPRALVPGLPRDLETVTLACLRKDPRRRYVSAGAIADDLQRWLDGFPIQARPVSKLEHASRWCRRRPAFASLLAILAFTLASSLVGLLTLWRHAEAERGRAENALGHAIESDKAASGTIHDLVGVLATTVNAPQMLAAERFQETSHAVRELTTKMRRHQDFTTSDLVAICALELHLAGDFRRRGNYPESRLLLMDSMELLEESRPGASDADVDEAYAQASMELGWVALNQERFDEALVCFRRAEDVLKGLVQDARRLDVIISVDLARRRIASLFARDGQEEKRRRLLESHMRMLERLSEHAGADPAIGLLAALVGLDLTPDDDARARLRAAICKVPAEARHSQLFQGEVAHWIAADVQTHRYGSISTRESKSRLDLAAHAEAIIRALESECNALGVYPALLPSAAFQMACIQADRGSELRRARRLDDARQIAAFLSALGRSLERRDPEGPACHLILSIAFEQESKNAWKVKDYATIENALSHALGEAFTALRLDPRDADTRHRVAFLQDKLVALAHGRPSSRRAGDSRELQGAMDAGRERLMKHARHEVQRRFPRAWGIRN
jgi:hypothetical protein